jgi:cytochrome c oxidase cbb3-type subunit I/II
MIKLGVPYPADYADKANNDLNLQANNIVNGLKKDGIQALPNSELIALIAYLQRMGTDIKASKTAENR